MSLIDEINATSLRGDIPFFRPEDTFKVRIKVVRGSRIRARVSQGTIIARQGGGVSETFIIRRISFGVGVKCTFPVHTPSIEKTEVVTRGQVYHVKLYCLYSLCGKAAKIKECCED